MWKSTKQEDCNWKRQNIFWNEIFLFIFYLKYLFISGNDAKIINAPLFFVVVQYIVRKYFSFILKIQHHFVLWFHNYEWKKSFNFLRKRREKIEFFLFLVVDSSQKYVQEIFLKICYWIFLKKAKLLIDINILTIYWIFLLNRPSGK